MKYLFQIIVVIIMGKFCSGCGMELEEGAKFCPTCGTKVESASLAVPSAQTVATDITETQPQNVPVNPVVQAQTFQPSETTNFVASDYAYSIPESRNFVKTLLLSVVTLGIYGIYWFDGVVSIGISILICISGVKIFIESYNVLMDASIDETTKKEILDIIHKYKDIQKVDHFSSTPVGYKYLVSVSIYIDGNMSTYDSHEIADKLEKELNYLEPVYLSIIHVNPI